MLSTGVARSRRRSPTVPRVSAAVDTVEAEVRELVRRRGLDPVADRGAVRRLVEEVVDDYEERSLTSSLTPLTDPGSAVRAVYDAVAGFGPLQRHLDDPTVEEIWINEPADGPAGLRAADRLPGAAGGLRRHRGGAAGGPGVRHRRYGRRRGRPRPGRGQPRHARPGAGLRHRAGRRRRAARPRSGCHRAGRGPPRGDAAGPRSAVRRGRAGDPGARHPRRGRGPLPRAEPAP